jgi:putative cardiolipin synthase
MIDSPELGRAGAESLLDRLSLRSYRPMLRDGDMVWRGQGPHGQPQIWPHEPGLGVWDRVAVYVLNVLPIEWLL